MAATEAVIIWRAQDYSWISNKDLEGCGGLMEGIWDGDYSQVWLGNRLRATIEVISMKYEMILEWTLILSVFQIHFGELHV